jgi:dynactin complex subunit
MGESSQSDHDLLIALNTKMEMLLSGQQMFIQQWGALIERVTAIEIQQSRNMSEIKNIEEKLMSLEKKASFADSLNMVVTAVASVAAGAIGYFFGPR